MRKVVLFFFLIVGFLFASDESVTVKAKKVGEYVIVDADNKNPFSVTIIYNASLKNLKSDQKLPVVFVMHAHSSQEILHLHVDKDPFTLKANYKWTIGSKYAQHDSSYLYRLPYKLGIKQIVAQGFNGFFSHYGTSQYAVDFDMKEGSEVYAARDGKVVDMKYDSNVSGPTREFEKYANFIIIEHSDETLATYAHLEQNGIIVKVGEQVKRGQLIGYSGKTGFVNGAHLHFIVYKAVDGITRESFPIKFISQEGIISEPITGQSYVAK
jgi:murein DD-endopeptidase MepM/ murein hydrolase activator NlpD